MRFFANLLKFFSVGTLVNIASHASKYFFRELYYSVQCKENCTHFLHTSTTDENLNSLACFVSIGKISFKKLEKKFISDHFCEFSDFSKD